MAMRTKSLSRAFLKILHSVGQAAPVLVSVRRISDTDRSRLSEVSKWAMVGVFFRGSYATLAVPLSCFSAQDRKPERVRLARTRPCHETPTGPGPARARPGLCS